MALHAAVAAPLVTVTASVAACTQTVTNLLKSRTDPFSGYIGQIPKFGESDSPCSSAKSAVVYGNNRRGVGLWPALRGPWAAEATYIYTTASLFQMLTFFPTPAEKRVKQLL